MINILDKKTIDQIAAGEVVERPASVVKELVENAIDAGASAVTVEVKDGGVGLIRITDNGSGIDAKEVRTAFYRHATSKIKSSEDLMSITSLGFRGEALSSIASIAKVELLTKTKDSFVGTRYEIEGGDEISLSEAGCPDGTTFLVKDIFYNTPARRKFLKSATTETGYITELIEKLALSHPEVSFKMIASGKVLLHTSGNGKLADVMLELYGIDTAKALLEINVTDEENGINLRGVICKPHISRGNRSYEGFFVNGRFVRSKVLSEGLEDGYKGFLMGHSFPVCALFLTTPADFVDVNVHPSKLEIKFSSNELIYRMCLNAVRDALTGRNMIVKAVEEKKHSVIVEEKKQKLNDVHIPEPFEKPAVVKEKIASFTVAEPEKEIVIPTPVQEKICEKTPELISEPIIEKVQEVLEPVEETEEKNPSVTEVIRKELVITESVQEEIPLDLYHDNKKEFKLIGQVFSTYWMIEMDNTLFIIDQHAAHEKVLFEKTMKRLREKEDFLTQKIMPGELISLSIREAEALRNNKDIFEKLGFEIDEFGGNEFIITGIPAELVDIDLQELFKEIMNNLLNERETKNSEVLLDRIATISCKAAVKGNNSLSEAEMRQLISDMLSLENPYHCPHGRPTTISMTKSELEKKFRRVL